MFVTLVADPPWKYRDKLKMSDVARSSDAHYPTMTVDQIMCLSSFERQARCLSDPEELTVAGYPVADIAVLFLWITNPFLLNGDGPRVCRAWGFEPKQLITWIKGELRLIQPHVDEALRAAIIGPPGMGHYTRGDTEHMILAVRGQATSLVKSRSIRNWFVAPKSVHSAKPEESYQLVEKLVPGPYLELFARRARAGWTQHGNQLQ